MQVQAGRGRSVIPLPPASLLPSIPLFYLIHVWISLPTPPMVIWFSQFLYPFNATEEPRPSGNLRIQPEPWFLESKTSVFLQVVLVGFGGLSGLAWR